MTDKYTLQLQGKGIEGLGYYHLLDKDRQIALVYCHELVAALLVHLLNTTSRAGQVKSKAKAAAAKRNIAKRWDKPSVGIMRY